MPETLRVLGIADDTPGFTPAGIYRLRMPLAYLERSGWPCRIVHRSQITQLDYQFAQVIVSVGVYPQTLASLMELEARAVQLRKLVVRDLDDDEFHAEAWNPSAGRVIQDRTAIEWSLRSADVVTVTTDTLRRRVRNYNHAVAVCPNSVDPEFWRNAEVNTKRIVPGLTVGVQGSLSHIQDWQILGPVIPKIAAKYPDVTFVAAGNLASHYAPKWKLGKRLITLPWVEPDKLPASLAQIDIGLAPLLDTVFNRSKSPIKWMEYAMVGAPCVCSPTVYSEYVTHGDTAYIARTADEWVTDISRLIESAELRRTMAERAKADVLKRFNIEQTAILWAEAYRRAWKRKFPVDAPKITVVQ